MKAEQIGLLIALPIALIFFGGLIYFFLRFDAMLRRIYEADRERWRRLGGPVGFFWIPEEKTPFFRSTNSRNRLSLAFLLAGLKEPSTESCVPRSGHTTRVEQSRE